MNAIGRLLRFFILYGPFLLILLAPPAYLGIKSIVRKPIIIRDF